MGWIEPAACQPAPAQLCRGSRRPPGFGSPRGISDALSSQAWEHRGEEPPQKAAGIEQGLVGFVCDLILNEHLLQKKEAIWHLLLVS